MPPIEVTCAIIVDQRRILATQRSGEMPHPFKWEFPGGKVRQGESPVFCIKREILEELGVHLEVDRLLPSVVHHYESHSVKLIPFMGTIREAAIVLSEHREYRWIACDELDQVDWLEADVVVAGMVRKMFCQ
ncbi:MAG: (deoxy)nucleoside triphosphate pyrophosphohydrolase [Bacteroidota bacterium]